MPRFAEKDETIPSQQVEYADAEAGAGHDDGASLANYTTTNTEKAGSSKYADSTIGLEHVKAAKASERKLVRKLGASSSSFARDPLPRAMLTTSLAHRRRHPSSRRPALPLGLPRPVRPRR